MRNILLAACAIIGLAMGASAASADDNRYDNNGNYDNGGSGWGYQYQNNGSYSDNAPQPDWNDGGYRSGHDAVTPRSIVRDLQRNYYRNISQPVLSGRFYQVKAVNSHGHNVKLYIDRYSGEIARVKS
jgi:opacity protein-like surface antigen